MRPKSLLFLWLAFSLFPIQSLWAIDASGVRDWGRVLRETRERVRDLITPAPREPEICREEEVFGTLPAGVDQSQCQRTICTGNFWGDSAIDICCPEQTVDYGDEDYRLTYARCWIRYPTRPSSSEPWMEVQIPLESNQPTGAADSLMDDFSSWLLPSALARIDLELYDREPQPAVPPPPSPEWTQEERRAAAVVLQGVADQMYAAYTSELTSEVGEPRSELRGYADLAYATALWGAGFLWGGVPEDYCPSQLPACCFETDELALLWTAVADFIPESVLDPDFLQAAHVAGAIRTIALAIMHGHPFLAVLGHLFLEHVAFEAIGLGAYNSAAQIPDIYRISQHPELTGIAVDHLAMGLSTFMMDQSRTFGNPVRSEALPPDRPIYYADDTTRVIVGAIIHHFLPPEPRLLADSAIDTTVFTSLYALLRADPRAARLWVAQELLGTSRVSSGLTWRQRVEAGLSRVSLIKNVETQFLAAGGLYAYLGEVADKCGTGGCGNADETQTDNRHHEVDSGDCDAPCENSEEPRCQPPDCETNPEECDEDPEDTGSSENDPTWEDPDNQVPDCVPFYDEWILEGREVGASCYRECWENLPTGGNLCDPIRTDDLESGCTLSDGNARCETELPDYCVRNPSGLPCTNLCRNRPELEQCDQMCADDRSLPFCDKRCDERDHRPNYCGYLCRDDPSQPFCLDRCTDDANRPYCDDICARNHGREFCDEVCDRDPIGYADWCQRVCADSRFWGRGFCQALCRDDGGHSFCTGVCETNETFCEEFCALYPDHSHCVAREEERRRAEEEARRREEAASGVCRSGWNRYSLEVLWRNHGGCYPYVGAVKCCGSFSEANCYPDDGATNQACGDGEYCGCPTDGSERWDCCMLPDRGIPGYFQMQLVSPGNCAYQEWLVPATCSFGCASFVGQGNDAMDCYLVNVCPCVVASPYCNPSACGY